MAAKRRVHLVIRSRISKPAKRGLRLLVAVALVLPLSARAENDHLIVPRRRIGPVSLGMTAADVMRILGEPTQTNSNPVVTVYHWHDDLSVTVKTDTSASRRWTADLAALLQALYACLVTL